MTPEQFVAILGALALLIGAVGGLLVQIRAMRIAVNGHLTALVAANTRAAQLQGELVGRDHERAIAAADPVPSQHLEQS